MKNLLVSFSGGETSAFMAQWLKNHYREFGYENIVFVFANTGLENEETLKFVERCDKHFGLNVQWVEAYPLKKGYTFNLVEYETASRFGEPFERFIIKEGGIPNQNAPRCTDRLKIIPIKKFAKQWFRAEKYHTAIGIRKDEVDRMSIKAKEMGFIYPLISSKMIPTNKPMVNIFWRSMPFRLELKGYQGNCITCWKKSDKKLYQIAKENPEAFDFMDRMEQKYPFDKNGHKQVFFRKNRSVKQILEESKNWNGKIKNDADEYSYQLDLLGGESCEIWSECNN